MPKWRHRRLSGKKRALLLVLFLLAALLALAIVAMTHLKPVFTSAGINQTKHQIYLVVDVYVSILLPGFSTTTKFSNTYSVAETVIVGSVPDNYTYFSNGEDMEQNAEDYIMNNG